jgi:hypothetical protein
MTDQLLDYFIYKGDTGYIYTKSQGELPKPQDFDMKAKAPFTACYKGYMYMLGLKEGQLVLDTIFMNSEVGNKINDIEPLPIPENVHDLAPHLPYIPPRWNITASFILGFVVNTQDTMGLFLHHFPQIYTKLRLPINFTGQMTVSMQIGKFYYQFISTYRNMTGNKKEGEIIPNITEEQGLELRKILLDGGVLTEEMISIFEANPELSSDNAQEIINLFHYVPYILLEFKEGQLVKETELTQDQFIEESNRILRSWISQE